MDLWILSALLLLIPSIFFYLRLSKSQTPPLPAGPRCLPIVGLICREFIDSNIDQKMEIMESGGGGGDGERKKDFLEIMLKLKDQKVGENSSFGLFQIKALLMFPSQIMNNWMRSDDRLGAKIRFEFPWDQLQELERRSSRMIWQIWFKW